MECKKCRKEIQANYIYCPWCGWNQSKTPKSKKAKQRGNGQGSVYKLPNGKYRAVVVLGYEVRDGKKHTISRTKSDFITKKAALEYLPQLRSNPKEIDTTITFKSLYEKWLPIHEGEVSRSTINCYKAAFKYYMPIWYLKFAEIGIDDLQECIDDCDKGKRTRQNMKALGTLLYKYALPRGYVPENLNYAQFLKVRSGEVGTREAFTLKEIELIRQCINDVPYADYIYCMIYTGFRPYEFLSLEIEKYNQQERCFTGGGKTKAGTDRLVTVSPKIIEIVDRLIQGKRKGPIFCGSDGKMIPLKKFREEYFYPVLETVGIIRDESHKLTPYSCRHTFATFLKQVEASDKDKLELMGHTSTDMLRHYQHINYSDLRRITDLI